MTSKQLERLFDERGIDFARPGFYDSPRFREGEAEDPVFLANYAEYVNARAYSAEYLDVVRETVPRLSQVLFAELEAARVDGACVDLSNALVRMLENEGIWSCAVGGGITVSFPRASRLPQAHFAPIAPRRIAAGHMWVCVPPFRVVDVTDGEA